MKNIIRSVLAWLKTVGERSFPFVDHLVVILCSAVLVSPIFYIVYSLYHAIVTLEPEVVFFAFAATGSFVCIFMIFFRGAR